VEAPGSLVKCLRRVATIEIGRQFQSNKKKSDQRFAPIAFEVPKSKGWD
jgi:hypothetical protein